MYVHLDITEDGEVRRRPSGPEEEELPPSSPSIHWQYSTP